MTPQMDTSELNELKNVVQGRIYLPGEDGYDAARQVWNAMIDRRPANLFRFNQNIPPATG
jgi:hypothetical protein